MVELPKLLATLLAFVALGASILSGVEPLQCVIRGGLAFLTGMFSGQIWNLLFLPSPCGIKDGSQDQGQVEPDLESTEAASTS